MLNKWFYILSYAGVLATFLYFGYIMFKAGNVDSKIICLAFNNRNEYRIETTIYFIFLLTIFPLTYEFLKCLKEG